MPLLRAPSSGKPRDAKFDVAADTLDAHRKQYMLEEAQRDDAFRTALSGFQRKFETEQDSQSASEQRRCDEFDNTLSTFNETFQKNHLRRQKEYQDADAHYEERSQKAEAAREAIFLEGQRDRSRAFDIDQETRSKRSEWYSSARHMLLGEGHQRYKDKFIALENVLVEQFNGLLKGLGDTNQPSLPLHPDDHDQNFNDVSYKKLRKVTKGSSASTRTHHDYRTWDPTYADPYKIETSFRPRSPPSPALRPRTPTVWPTIATPSPEPIFTQPLVPSNYQLSPQRGRIQITEPVRAESAMNALQDQHLDIHSAFDNAQRKRQEHFSSQEQERERQFQAAETIREAGESGRDAEFTQRMEQWSKASQKLLAQNTTHSRGREEERLNWNRRRNAAFEATQERSRQVFEMSMLHIQRQAEAEEDFEDLWVKRQKTLIIALCKNQSIQISAGRFTQPYPDRDFSSYNPAVGRPLETTLSDNSSGSPSPEAPHRINSPLTLHAMEPPTVPPRQRPGWMHRWRKGFQLSKDTGFAPHVLFRGGPNIQRALPIAGDTLGNDSSVSETFARLKRRHQRLFERSQETRANLFEKGMQERRSIFATNDAKRSTNFLDRQQQRKRSYEEAEASREGTFQHAQLQRERDFQASERSRENEFNQDEANRNEEAKRSQEERGHRFELMQSMLQRVCIEGEERRLEDLEAWGDALMKRRRYEHEQWRAQVFRPASGTRKPT